MPTSKSRDDVDARVNHLVFRLVVTFIIVAIVQAHRHESSGRALYIRVPIACLRWTGGMMHASGSGHLESSARAMV